MCVYLQQQAHSTQVPQQANSIEARVAVACLPCPPSSSPYHYIIIVVRFNYFSFSYYIFCLFFCCLLNTLQLPDEEAQPRAHGAVSSTRSSLWQRSVHLQIIHCLQITHKKHEFIYYASTQKDHAPRVPSRNAKARDGWGKEVRVAIDNSSVEWLEGTSRRGAAGG